MWEGSIFTVVTVTLIKLAYDNLGWQYICHNITQGFMKALCMCNGIGWVTFHETRDVKVFVVAKTFLRSK